jgi:hypothetical protein
LAIPSAVWSSLSRLRRSQLSEPANPLFELSLPESVTQQGLADPPQRISLSHGLCVPTAHQETRVHWPQALPARYGPSSGFGYPRDGLLLAHPCRSCFVPAALVGFTLRSFLLSGGSDPFPERKTHIPFLLSVYPAPRCRAGSTGRGSWVFASRESLATERVFSTSTAGCSLGVHPLRVLQRMPWTEFRPPSSPALFRQDQRSRQRRLRVSMSIRPV